MTVHRSRPPPGRRTAAALALVLLLSAVFSLTARAQSGIPLPPHWFWGADFGDFEGAELRAVAADGAELGSTTIEHGRWLLYIASDVGRIIRFQLAGGSESRFSQAYELRYGELTQVPLNAFESTQQTGPAAIRLRIIARFLNDGRIEFGVRNAAGVNVLPQRRLFPTDPIMDRWLRSSEIELGGGVRGWLIARRLESGSTEFGLRISGADDLLPELRYVPASLNHGRWLRSSLIELPAAD